MNNYFQIISKSNSSKLSKRPTMAAEENIKVVVRIRDLIPREKGQEKVSVVTAIILITLFLSLRSSP